MLYSKLVNLNPTRIWGHYFCITKKPGRKATPFRLPRCRTLLSPPCNRFFSTLLKRIFPSALIGGAGGWQVRWETNGRCRGEEGRRIRMAPFSLLFLSFSPFFSQSLNWALKEGGVAESILVTWAQVSRGWSLEPLVCMKNCSFPIANVISVRRL